MIRVSYQSLLWQWECQKKGAFVWESVNRYSACVPGHLGDKTHQCIRKFEKWERIGERAQARHKREHHKAWWFYWKTHSIIQNK